MTEGKRHIIDKHGERYEDKKSKESTHVIQEMEALKQNVLSDDAARKALEATRDIQSLRLPDDLEMNDDLFMFEPIEVTKRAGFEYASEIKDSELFDKMYVEHPFKATVIKVGRIRSRKIRVKPGDIVYYDPSLKHNTFLFNGKKYLVGSIPMIVSIARFKESFLQKLIRRTKGWI